MNSSEQNWGELSDKKFIGMPFLVKVVFNLAMIVLVFMMGSFCTSKYLL